MNTVMEATPLKVSDRRSSALDEAPTSAQPLVPVGEFSQETVLLQVIARGAADKTVDLDRMERLLVMQERLAAKRAEGEFIAAMAEFKKNAPRIFKTKQVGFDTKDGGRTSYKHATLGAVCQAAIVGLASVGISHRWDLQQLDGGRVKVTCVLTHAGGHHTETELSGSPDDSGKKNNIQQVASTITYLERYTLLAATGLATDDQDDDGRGAGSDERPRITENQIADLEALITEVAANKVKFLAYLKVESLAQIYADKYPAVVQMLERKRKRK